jgi:hypothetical protein
MMYSSAAASSDPGAWLAFFLLGVMINAAICGGAGAYCSTQKGRGGTEGFWLSFFLGPFGVIAAACLPHLRGSTADPDAAEFQRRVDAVRAAEKEASAEAEARKAAAALKAAEKEAIAEAEARKAARRKERDRWYRDRGIKPGAWAWFRALPEVAQAVILGWRYRSRH